MALEQRLSLRLGQRLVMTPSLQQAIKLLQMTKLEVVEEVQQELLENPTLEEVQADGEGERPESESAEAAPAEEGTAEDSAEPDAFEDIDYEAFFANVDQEYTPRAPVEVREDLPDFGSTLAEQTNLADHLTWQLGMSTAPESMQEIGRSIIGNLDEESSRNSARPSRANNYRSWKTPTLKCVKLSSRGPLHESSDHRPSIMASPQAVTASPAAAWA